ncbi:hypothetical protein HK097_005858 [Rhizophlyctis rosea]|uniref:Uncharacterized protein n=1 Tax=Rhizophlyctis rosea TaxID=64517 RepID=A0AAD5S025_9FUNG|nr:hypothetical protein HK097_005858 [Rhizophlyctis rosea]
METLEEAESHINPAYLSENQPPATDWFSTILAIDAILTHKLYKDKYKAVHRYVDAVWKKYCNRVTFHRLGKAGKVIRKLEEAGIARDELPGTIALCHEILHIKDRRKDMSLAEIWGVILKRFHHRDSVIANKVSELFPEAPPAPAAVTTRPEKRQMPAAAEPPPDRQLRSRQRVSYAGNDSDEETELEPEPEVQIRKQLSPFRSGDRRKQIEWNTPQELADFIHEFAEKAFGGLSLDPCGNPESCIKSDHRYGRLGNDNNEFIDALTLPRWGVPGPEDDPNDASTWSQTADLVYVNPPYKSVDLEDPNRQYGDLFMERVLSEMEKGHIRAALYLIPLHVLYRDSVYQMFTISLCCVLKARLQFELSDHDRALSGRVPKQMRSAGTYAMVYLEGPNRTKEDEFVTVFGKAGLIAGYNIPVYNGTLKPMEEVEEEDG